MAVERESDECDALIDGLVSHDIRYLVGGQPGKAFSAAPLAALLVDLARAPSSRLRSALVALLLRHPAYAPVAEAAARDLTADSSARRLLLLSIVVAAALQSEWGFSLDLYLPNGVPIEVDRLVNEFGLPAPRENFGRPCLTAAARLLRSDSLFPVNYEEDWEHAARRLRAQLVREAADSGA